MTDERMWGSGKVWAARLMVLAVIFVFWEWAATSRLVDPILIGKPTGIDHVKTELVDQFGHPGLCAWVVTGNHQRSSVPRARRRAVARDLAGVDVVERLHDLRLRQVRLQHLGRGGRLLVELGDVAVALGVVVVRVDDDLARERCDGDGVDRVQRDGDDDDVATLGRLEGGAGRGVLAELRDEVGERLRSARVGHDDVVTLRHREACELRADVS